MSSAQYHQSALGSLKNPRLFISEALINGRWVKKDSTFDVIEPSTATVLGKVSNCGLEDFQEAIASAETAGEEFYRSTTAHQKSALLRKWYELITANEEDIGTILSLENGKTLSEAVGEVRYAASFVNWFAEEAPRAYGDTIPSASPHTNVLTFREPVGVCGIITPWNFPAAMITRKIAPAFAAGCSVVVKPPSETPYTCAALAKLAIDAGLPPKIFQVLPTKDCSAATELCTNPIVKKISFTGSTGVGKMLAMGTMKRVSLELGGNAPFIVFEDADLDLAVEGAMFCKFRCTGQTCVCANRILVHQSIAKEFGEKLVSKVAALQVGPGLDPKTTQGPVVNQSSVDKVTSHISDAVSKGAEILIGGAPVAPGFFFQPTVLSGVPRDALVATDETFGPLAPIFTFSDEEDALKLANATDLGLAGYFFSRDVSRVMRVAARLKVGMVGVNTGKISAAEAPFGGVGNSGFGREGSKYGLAEYQNIKAVTIGNFGL
ncbi:Aldehyde/histidinol dehydrogenase [Boeremia exigua]|uniref:Aldehyde/histidinol dehydrogenase n=1 Tax=Boeremia exigua TaxID=749465 RepID=UPI001E8EE9C3|nr:Aldehyde/histidinol dehydrogenase [Boeremia exigua]KAH6632890.1 Aldehyde/histidinol dehydrogenase [Boeremia exigua]